MKCETRSERKETEKEGKIDREVFVKVKDNTMKMIEIK